MAPSDVPVEAISDYLENIARKLIQGGIPAERVVQAVKLTSVRVQAICPAEPTKALAPPSDAPTFAAVLERLQAQAKRDTAGQVEDRPERRKAGRPWWKPTSEAEPEAPEETHPVMPDAARRGTGGAAS
jgi:hypothetical protein